MSNPNQPRQIRIHATVWDHYKDLCKREWGQTRAERLNDLIRDDFAAYGTREEVTAVAEALGNLTPTGRPPVEPSDSARFDRLRQLSQLHRAGVLTDAEYEAAQARVLVS